MLIDGAHDVLKLFRKDDVNVKTSIIVNEKLRDKLETSLGIGITRAFPKKFLINITILTYNGNFICKKISSHGIFVVPSILKNYDEKNIQAIRIDIWSKDFSKQSWILFKV